MDYYNLFIKYNFKPSRTEAHFFKSLELMGKPIKNFYQNTIVQTSKYHSQHSILRQNSVRLNFYG
jgi:hypothetical protein